MFLELWPTSNAPSNTVGAPAESRPIKTAQLGTAASPTARASRRTHVDEWAWRDYLAAGESRYS